VRLTVVSPAATTDVEVDEGVPVARLRGGLARLTGEPSWRSAPVSADGIPLTDEHPTGLAPLRHGATLRPGTGPVPDAVRAARAPWHLAVVAGPDTGALLVPEGPATLGPGGHLPVRDDELWLVLLRPRAAGGGRRRVLVVRRPVVPSTTHRRPGWRRPVPLLRVRGTTSPAFLVSARGRRRRVRRWRWTAWRVGDSLQAGSSTLVVRRPDTALAPSRHRAALAGWRRYLPAVAGATTSAALAATMHQPVLLLGALSALVLVGPRAAAAPHVDPVPAPDAPLDLAALRVDVAAASGGAWDGASGRRPPPEGPRAGGGSWSLGGASAAPSPTGVSTTALSPTASSSFARGWDGDLAVVGRRPAALAAARGLALGVLAAEPATAVELRTDRLADWSWLVWFGGVVVGPTTGTASAGAAAPARTGPRLIVLDGRHGHAAVAGSARVLRVVDGRPPPWCAAVIEVDGRTARPARDALGTRPYVGVSAAVADATARALAGRSHGSRDHPGDVLLGDLPGVPPPDPGAVALRWARPTLAVPLGRAADGSPVVADLVRDGPHALVAGTTGSGKSELLATITLGLALSQPPDRLAVLLVDFKGATGLPPALAELPHVIGHVSDLDAAGARRTLRGLAAELRRRERVLATRGARDLAELDPGEPGTPPRLLVVVDEFRALADELPELLPSWARLAAQGRSLGVHLLLATQRPAGAVPADLRANVGLRVVLRVVDAADSSDLVGVPDAAGFDRPGVALLSRGPGRPELLHVARAVPHRPHPPVRLAAPWPADPGGGWAPPAPPGDARREPRRDPATSGRAELRTTRSASTGSAPGGPAPRAGDGRATRPDDGPAAWVAAIRAAAGDRPPATGPWLPPLPARVASSDVPPGPGLPLALADLPDDLARGPVRWDADAGHLLVLGGPGSGRSTALSAAAAAALAEGRPVHAVGLPAVLLPPGVSSRLAADDGPRVARLIRLLAGSRPAGERRPLLVVDDVATVVATLAPLARGAALECLEQLWAAAGGPVAVAAAGGIGAATQRLAPFFADRLVLGSPDPTGDLLAGVPLELAGPRAVPGRAIHLGRGCAALCQVAPPAPNARHETGPRIATPSAPGGRDERDGDVATPCVRPLPAWVAGPLPRPEAPPTGRGPLVTLGLGGDDAGPVAVDLGHPLLVVGPRGSGRTAALDVLAAGAAAAGLRTVRPAAPADLDAEGALLVVDDLDDLAVQDPALSDALTARLTARDGVRLVAATTTAHAVGAFRGPVPALCRAGRLLVLDVTEPGAADLLGPEGPWLADARRQPPGRGALRLGRDVVPLQVVAPE
jgi:S-DNA-T family DNA segregation ATPase FtsK/SpoIIIE